MEEQSQGTFDEDFNVISFYNWTGGDGALSPRVPNGGNGEPKASTGMVGTHHRPSDDLSVYGMANSSRAMGLDLNGFPVAYLTPANAMLSVELVHLAGILDGMNRFKNVSKSARKWSSQIRGAIWKHTVQCSSVSLSGSAGDSPPTRYPMASLRTKPMGLVVDT
jgi:meiotically up-regulated gene 157 (Mug157) protein